MGLVSGVGETSEVRYVVRQEVYTGVDTGGKTKYKTERVLVTPR